MKKLYPLLIYFLMNIGLTIAQNEQISDAVMDDSCESVEKSLFTGSVWVIKNDEIEKRQVLNVSDVFSGLAAGVHVTKPSGQPGFASNIRIRGIGSIYAGNSPLYVLDGIPYNGDISLLNTADIESVTVLKDAASNAIYGIRSANGVILITTKKGKSGKPQISVNARWGANTRATQDYNFVKSPAQYYEMYYGALRDYFVNTMNYSPEDAYRLANQTMTSGGDYGLGYNVYNVPTGQYLIDANGKLNPNARLGNVVNYGGEDYYLTPDNWLKAAYKQSLRQEYNLTATAGTDKSTFFMSVGYLDNEGITPKSDFKRLTGRLKADYQVKSWLKTGANLAYANYNYNSIDPAEEGSSGSSGNLFAIATRIAPIYPLYIRDGQGNIRKDSNGLTMYDYGDKENAGLERPFWGMSNAVGSLYWRRRKLSQSKRFCGIYFLQRFQIFDNKYHVY